MAKKKSGGATRSLESAISLPIVNSFEELSEINSQGFESLSTVMGSVVDSLSTLNSTFARMLDLQQDQLDQEKLALIKQSESDLEKSRTEKDGGGVAFGKNATGIGMGIIAAISGTLIGLAQGFLESFKNTMTAVKTMVIGLKDWFFGTKFFDDIKLKVGSFFSGISMQFDLAKAWFAESKIGMALTEVMNGWKTEFDLWKTGIKNGLSNILKFLKIDDAISGWKAEIELWRPTIDAVKKGFTFVKDSILGFGTSTDEAKGVITKVFTTISENITKLKTFFSGMFDTIGGWLKTLSGVDGVFATIGKTIGKLLYPFTVIMTLIDTVSGAVKGYQEEGFLGGIKGAITGFIGGIIGAPLDLLKDLISWLSKKVGLETFSKLLDSFNFVDAIKNMVNGMFDGIIELLATIAEKVPLLGDAAAEKIRSFKTKEATEAKTKQNTTQEDTMKKDIAEVEAIAANKTPLPMAAPAPLTDEDRKTEAYQAILKAEPVRRPGEPASERARIFRADQKYRQMQKNAGVEGSVNKGTVTTGVLVDRSSRQAAVATTAPVVVAPSSTNVNAPTVNTSNSTTMAPASPRPNAYPAGGGLYIDPILGM